MNISAINRLILLQFLLLNFSFCQNYLGGPECVNWDSARQQYVVSNWTNGRIVTIDTLGNQTIFNDDLLHAYGNCILGDTLFVSTGLAINAYNLISGERLFNLPIPGVQQMDGIAVDPAGFVYVMENINPTIFKIRLSDLSYWVFCDSGLQGSPQDLLIEKEFSRLLVVSFFPSSPVYSVSLSDSSCSELVTTPMGDFDGLAKDTRGNYYLSSWNTGAIHMYNRHFTNPPLLVSDGHNGPANIGANLDKGLIAVPNFNSNTISYIPFPDNYLRAVMKGSIFSGNAPLTVQFSDVSYAAPEIESWAWDFQNDGVVDAQDPNPTWTFTETGSYDVSLIVSTANGSDTCLIQNYIQVFNGESAINYNATNSYGRVAANPGLNLQDSLCLEAWIHPTGWGASAFIGGTILSKLNFTFFLTERATSYNNHSLVLKMTHEDGSISHHFTPENSIELDRWTHVAVSYCAADSLVKIFLDGVEQEPSTLGTATGPIADNLDFDLYLGSFSNGSLGFKGAIDEVKIWGTLRNTEQIRADMDKNTELSEAGLLAYWSMNEGGGTTLSDVGPHGNTAFLENVSWTFGAPGRILTNVNQATERISLQSHLLLSSYPNPFNAMTTISFSLGSPTDIKLDILDMRGRRVRNLVHGCVEAGVYHIQWDTRDEQGKEVNSGLYIVRLLGGTQISSMKMLFIK
ncbi:MAG: PKD domain-containing protein [Candidatus Marinimicrobia bacterium]|nr:PKD domain-containing protein [Candidatus Neomarinimicrobiota bacterium]